MGEWMGDEWLWGGCSRRRQETGLEWAEKKIK